VSEALTLATPPSLLSRLLASHCWDVSPAAVCPCVNNLSCQFVWHSMPNHRLATSLVSALSFPVLQQQPRQSLTSKLPPGGGYTCPQQLRLWLQQQPTAHLEASSSQQAGTAAVPGAAGASKVPAEGEEGGGRQAAEPRAKRQKRGRAQRLTAGQAAYDRRVLTKAEPISVNLAIATLW
jgi:hypothetical protein